MQNKMNKVEFKKVEDDMFDFEDKLLDSPEDDGMEFVTDGKVQIKSKARLLDFGGYKGNFEEQDHRLDSNRFNNISGIYP